MLTTTLIAILPLLASTALAVSNYGVVDIPHARRFEKRIGAANATTSPVERSTIEKRAYSGRATWYQAGLGACGGTNSPSDKIVALGQVIWDTDPAPGNNPNNSPWCGKKVCISYGGQSHEATIVDLCPYSGGCSPSDGAALDMSQSLFEQFGSLDLGIFQMTWTLGGCGGGSVDVDVNVASNNDNNASEAADKKASDKAAADKAAADSKWQEEQAAKKAASDKAASDKAASDKAAADSKWQQEQDAESSSSAAAAASKSASDAAEEKASSSQAARQAYLASVSSAENAQYLASLASESAASESSEARYEYYSSLSAASVARLNRIESQSEASVQSVSSARSEYYAEKSQASVASRSSARSEYFESKSQASVASIRRESRVSASAAATMVAPVVTAMQNVNSFLEALLAPQTEAPSAAPSASPSS